MFKGDFKTKLWKNFRDFEGDETKKKQKREKKRLIQKLDWQTKCLDFLNLFKALQLTEWLELWEKARYIK